MHTNLYCIHYYIHIRGFNHMLCVEGPVTRKVHICSHPSFVKGCIDACKLMQYNNKFNNKIDSGDSGVAQNCNSGRRAAAANII